MQDPISSADVLKGGPPATVIGGFQQNCRELKEYIELNGKTSKVHPSEARLFRLSTGDVVAPCSIDRRS